MRYALLIAIALAAGCAKEREVDATTYKEIDTPKGMSIERFGPDEYGVVCYRKSVETFSCVKVQP